MLNQEGCTIYLKPGGGGGDGPLNLNILSRLLEHQRTFAHIIIVQYEFFKVSKA